MRTLASIQRIIALDPIPDADAILRATVLGWQLVVKKDEFKVGDLVVYCEIDSMLPDRPEFEFLKARGNRIRTVRLRGQISQGICFPLSVLPEGTDILEGADVTEIMNVIKYEPPIPAQLAGLAKGLFPSFIPKTDETRVQILQPLLDKYKGTACYIAEKLDGSSATYYLKDGVFGACTRNMDLQENEANTLWRLARAMKFQEKLSSLGKNVAIQGELIGEGIQGNKYKLKGQDVRFFNVFFIDEYRYADFEEFVSIMKQLELITVPILDTDYKLDNSIETLVALSVAKSVLSDVQREGIVIRPLKEQIDKQSRVSFKSINPEFLLKYE